MKNFLKITIVLIVLVVFNPPEIKAQKDYAAYLGVRDTLANTDTTAYEVTISGPKAEISIQCKIDSISGTVAGKFEVYGSVDGVYYETAVITSVTKVNTNFATIETGKRSAVYVIKFTNNNYKKLKVLSTSSGTNNHSQRVYLLYRGR